MSRIPRESRGGCSPVIELEDFDSDLMGLDKYWNSEAVKKTIATKLKSMIKGNTSCFNRIDTRPLYRKGSHGYYRVIFYIKDYLQDGYISVNRIYLDFSVEVDLTDFRVCGTNPPLVGKI